tara:strand:+ start:4742 stop:5347 length:606 start_codon:yes stop_codon:yes gene_type:complete
VLSSSLLAHPRCLEILNVPSLPLREALIEREDKIIDNIIKQTAEQKYKKRKKFILYLKNSQIVNKLNYEYLEIWFSKTIRDDLYFERIIFQRQSDEAIVIVIHCTYFNEVFYLEKDIIIEYLNKIFNKHQMFLDLFLEANLIDIINWKASQPISNLLSENLQWSPTSNIGFCGDWFAFKGRSGVEQAINSAIRLANLLKTD